MKLRASQGIRRVGRKQLSNRAIGEDDLALGGQESRRLVIIFVYRQQARIAFDHDGAGFLKARSHERHSQGAVGIANPLLDPFGTGARLARAPAPQDEPQAPVLMLRLVLVGPSPPPEVMKRSNPQQLLRLVERLQFVCLVQ
jgi:hypothetical protein